MKLNVGFPVKRKRAKRSSTKVPLSGLPVVQYGGATGWDGELELDLLGQSEFDKLAALDAQQTTMLLKWFDGTSEYVDFPADFEPTQDADDHWTGTGPYGQTGAPPGEELARGRLPQSSQPGPRNDLQDGA